MASTNHSRDLRESTLSQRQQMRLRLLLTTEQLPQLEMQVLQMRQPVEPGALDRQDKLAACWAVLVALAVPEVVAVLVVAVLAAVAVAEALPHPARADKLDNQAHPVRPEHNRMAKMVQTAQMDLTGPMAQRAAKVARVVKGHAMALVAELEPVAQHHNQDHSQHR